MDWQSPISVEEFMRSALYDSRHGYYARRISGIGARGDFTTAPMLSGAPAAAIARWAMCALRETGCRDLIEIGPGEGLLMRQIISRFPWFRKIRTRFHLVETSTPLREKQRALLGKRVTWHHHPAAALNACGGRAVIFSNELVDAFPVRVFRKVGPSWHEVFVAAGPREILRPAPLPDSTSHQIPAPAGQQIEIHESYRTWQQSWLPLWQHGKLLTIDYGATAEQLYHRRPHGTLRSYFMHQTGTGLEIYQNPGRRDLTADVNFSDLIRWGESAGLASRLVDFSTFLTEHQSPPPTAWRDGVGTAFLVLEQWPLDETKLRA